MKALPDLATDVPKLSTYLVEVIFAVLDNRAIQPTDILWYQPGVKKEGEEEEECIFVEEYYKLMAQLLVKFYSKYNNWNDVVK